ncbi:VP4 [Eubenangee virus]|uniref:Core protein VP4 n=1 Tax=Eubenangee virus TaxID=40056 RepID=H9ZXR5_9REOV|nr:VP4 [Eubenangee virus]AFH41512.1 VP4 [Eubenangee virus]
MAEPHAVLYVTSELEPLAELAFLPKWELSGDESLNELWLKNGCFGQDVYCYGRIAKWSARQLRAHGFIFISTKKSIRLKDCMMPVDIRIPLDFLIKYDVKKFETFIGRKRISLRKSFGNILRRYALSKANYFHGSEAETLNIANPRIHHVKGMPRDPPTHYSWHNKIMPDDDEGTDEKLVSMLDYMMYSAEEVHYIGSGDLRTLYMFKKRNPRRFNQATWHVYDPIAETTEMSNVIVHKEMVTHHGQIMANINVLKRVERIFIWDVSGDRGPMNSEEWEEKRDREDRKGESMALELEGAFSLALIKHRVPQHMDKYWCTTSALIPQPSAPKGMYELRNIIRLNGYSYVNRSHIPPHAMVRLNTRDMQAMCERFHVSGKGKKLKKLIFEFLHIEREDGLAADLQVPRADLFYLTCAENRTRWEDVKTTVMASQISTLWVGKNRLFDYNDFRVERSEVMLTFSSREVRVFDGNGAVLYLMWKYPYMFDKTLNYDPAWAANFAVMMKEPIPQPAVPDLSLCRFIGLRIASSIVRLNNPGIHAVPDELKAIGLDLSGHLFMTLVSGAYLADLRWWLAMILEWSSQDGEEKKRDIERAHAEVIEWKEDMAFKPWHVRNDLIAALREYTKYCTEREKPSLTGWIMHLQNP